MNEISNKKKKNRFVPIAVAAALVLVCLGGYLGYSYGSAADPGVTGNIVEPSTVPSDAAVDSIITLDVNPSLNIIVDAADKVIEVQPLNDDARTVIGDMDFAGSDLDVTVNALIGSMLMNGYLDDIRNSILVSVANGDTAKAESLQQQVSDMINSAVGEGGFEASVLTQTVTSTSETASLAQQYGISVGKAALIQEVIAQDSTLTFEALAPLSVNEIALITESRHLASQSVTQTGSASTKAYITAEEAKNAALTHAGVSESSVAQMEIEFDSEDGLMVYEVEFYAGGAEYDYDINARTGEVVKFSREGGSGSATGGGATSSGSSGTYIGEAAATAAALADAGISEGDTTYLRCWVEHDDGRAECYEVEFLAGSTEYQYEIDLYTGAILQSERETRGASGGNTSSGNASGSSSMIGEAAARSAALAHAGVSESSASRIQVELDRDDGQTLYEVEFHVGRTEYSYEIDAYTGAILKAEQEIDD